MLKVPVSLEILNGFATMRESDGNIVPELVDIELGWTDTSTGNYVSPDEALSRLEFIRKAVNSHAELLGALEKADDRLRAIIGISQYEGSNTGAMIMAAITKATGG